MCATDRNVFSIFDYKKVANENAGFLWSNEKFSLRIEIKHRFECRFHRIGACTAKKKIEHKTNVDKISQRIIIVQRRMKECKLDIYYP